MLDNLRRRDGCKTAVTAAQIAKGQLEPLGKRIAVHLEKMRGYEAKAQEKAGVELRKAEDHWNSVSQLLAEAKAKCDSGGFKAFQSKYCPDLGRSRIYELLAIGSGKKTIEASRAATRGRVKKHRAVSVTSTVTDKKEVAKKVWAESAQAMAAARDRQAVQADDDVEARAKLDTQPEDKVVAAAANKLHRELMNFHQTFTPKLDAWVGTKPTNDGLDEIHNALRLVTEELLRLASEISGIRGAAAPRTDPTAEESAAARKAQHAAAEDLAIPGFLLRKQATDEAAT
jgi:hypothetical protein